jgi:hypothetical protein
MALLPESVTVESSAARSETARRCEDIMTYLPRSPAMPDADCTGTIRANDNVTSRTNAVRRKLAASYTASTTVRVTKAREQLN